MHRSRALRSLSLLALVVPLLVSVTGSPSAAEPADLVLSARVPAVPQLISGTGASGDVLAYTLLVQATGRPSAAYLQVPGQAPLRYPRASAQPAGPYALLQEFPASDRELSSYRMVDTRDGSSRPVPSFGVERPLGPLADGGWYSELQGDGQFRLVRFAADGTERASVRLGADAPSSVTADEEGVVALLRVGGIGTNVVDVVYADWATGTLSRHRSSRQPTEPALTDGSYGYGDGQVLVRRSRETRQVLSTRTVAGTVGRVALQPSAFAWTTTEGGTTTTVSAWTSRDAEPGRHVRAATGLRDVYQRLFAYRDAFALTAGSNGATLGLYEVGVGATSLGRPLVLVGAQAPERLAVSPGRVVFTQQTRYGTAFRSVEQGVDITPDGPRLRGPERVVAIEGTLGGNVLLSGGLTANIFDRGRDTDAVVFDSGAEVARVRSTGSAVGLSGTRLVLYEPTYAPADGAVTPSTRVVDSAGGDSRPVTVTGWAGLDGPRLAVLSPDGSVTLRDLDTDAPPRLLREPSPRPDGAQHGRVQVADGWVAWSWQGHDAGLLRTTALELETGREVTVEARHEAVRLAGGRLAWIDADDREVHLLELSSGTDTVLDAQPGQELGDGLLGLTPEMVVWVDPRGQTRVRALPAPQGPPELLAADGPDAFGTSGLRLRLEADRPVREVELTVTDAAGRVVARERSTAPDGGLRPVWDARRDDGSVAPQGRYAWSVRARADSGDLQPTADAPLQGSAVLDTVAPAVAAALPVLASDTSVSPSFRIGWSTPDPGAVLDVQVTKRGRQRHGTFAFGPLRAWQRGVRPGSAVYGGSGVPYLAPPGTLLRFVVTARDAAGNRTSTTAREVLVPFDDGDAPQRYSAGWTRRSSASAYGGGVRVATTPGRSVSLRAKTDRLTVTGERCRGCGSFQVLVDGRVVRTVSTSGAAASRARLLDLRLPGGSAVHSVQLRTTGGRVALDAVGLVS